MSTKTNVKLINGWWEVEVITTYLWFFCKEKKYISKHDGVRGMPRTGPWFLLPDMVRCTYSKTLHLDAAVWQYLAVTKPQEKTKWA